MCERGEEPRNVLLRDRNAECGRFRRLPVKVEPNCDPDDGRLRDADAPETGRGFRGDERNALDGREEERADPIKL